MAVFTDFTDNMSIVDFTDGNVKTARNVLDFSLISGASAADTIHILSVGSGIWVQNIFARVITSNTGSLQGLEIGDSTTGSGFVNSMTLGATTTWIGAYDSLITYSKGNFYPDGGTIVGSIGTAAESVDTAKVEVVAILFKMPGD